MEETARSLYAEPERQQGFSQSDYLRLAAAGADIMGAQSTGRGGVIGALQAAGPALGSLGRDLGTSMGEREADYQDKLNRRNQVLASAAGEEFMADKKIAADKDALETKITAESESQEALFTFQNEQAEILATATLEDSQKARDSAELIAKYQTDNKMFEFREKTKDFNQAYASKSVAEQKLQAAEDLQLSNEEITKLNDDISKADALMGRLQAGSPEADTLEAALDNLLTPDAVDTIISEVQTALDKEVLGGNLEEFSDEYFEKKQKYLEQSLYTYFIAAKNTVKQINPSDFRSGGRVGLQRGGDPMMEQMAGPGATQPAPMNEPQQASQITFEELRSRLPQEVTDKVITLLVQSQEALLDFTRIQVPEDINKFNQKYGADLTLPTQVV